MKNVVDVLKGQDYDIVLDCVGGAESWAEGRKVLKKGMYWRVRARVCVYVCAWVGGCIRSCERACTSLMRA